MQQQIKTIPTLCPDWHRRPMSDDERIIYGADELRRLDAAGAPVLTAALAALDGGVQQLALGMIAGDILHPAGGLVVSPRVWRLRLRPGAEPPHIDPQGRPIEGDRRGKVLVAKIGNHGAGINLSTMRGVNGSGRTEWCGEARAQVAAAGGDLYQTVEIGRDWVDVTMQVAVLVLRQWGIGVQRQRYRTRAPWRPGMPQEPGQDRWLVEEYCAQTAGEGREGRAEKSSRA